MLMLVLCYYWLYTTVTLRHCVVCVILMPVATTPTLGLNYPFQHLAKLRCSTYQALPY